MTRTLVQYLAAVALVALHTAALPAQVAGEPPLADYVGTFRYPDGRPIEIVAGRALFAVLDEAKYKLTHVDVDRFMNGVGDTIPFERDARGRVVAFRERGTRFPRLSARVTPTSAALAWPRPPKAGSVPAYHYRVPQARSDGIAVAHVSQSDLGVETVERLVNSVLDSTNADVHGLLLYQRGALVLEEYFYGYSSSRSHQLRSATKSFVSAVAGIAVDRGAIAGATARVAPALPYTVFANPDQRKAAITLGDLLSMRPGLACNDYDATSPGRETVIDESPDWVKATMDLPMVTDPGTVAHYCSGAVAVTGRLVERSVGEPLPRYAQRHLFAPLGIPRDHWRWNHTLTNTNREYAQRHIRPRDLLKFGLLYANGGLWRGRRVLSESWVRASLAEQTQIDGTGYGYFWWRPWLNVTTSTGVQRVTFNSAQGNGGQKIHIIPELDLVAVFTGGDYNSGGSPPNRMMASIILPRLLEARR